MIRLDMQQGSEEWRRVRMGKPTASEFHRILTPGGKPSKSAEGYLYSLLAELMLGRPLDAPSYPWMQRGHDLESDAALWYEMQCDVTTEIVGFCTTDDGTVGASPDRLVGDDGQLELKCPSPETHVRYLLFPQKGVDAEYRVQVQGQLYVTKRAWCDVVSYHPDLPSVIVRVERDEEYIALLAEALTTFCAQLAEGKAELERRGLLKVEGERTSTRTRRPSTEHQRPMTFNEQILHYLDHGMRD
jgi:putative phage-type endonuclease